MPLRLRPLLTAIRAARLTSLFLGLTALLLTLPVAAQAQAYRGVTFYVVAHPDDWQLFMGEAAYDDLADPTQKVVFIYLSAGDANQAARVQCGGFPGAQPYYLAREAGALASVRLVADRQQLNGCPGAATATTAEFRVTTAPAAGQEALTRTRRLHRVAYLNSVSYFLRLPDAPNPRTNTGDYLTDFYHDARRGGPRATTPLRITPVDSSTTYQSWVDLTQTVRAILVRESAGLPEFTVNLPETDSALNPSDHPQHLIAGHVVLDALPADAARLVRWVGYDIDHRPDNLLPLAVVKKTGLYAAYNTAKVLAGATSDWSLLSATDGDFRRLARSYSRTTSARLPPPAAPARR